MNYFSDEKEWLWLFEHGLDWEKIIPLYFPTFPTEDGAQNTEEAKDFLKELLTATGEWCGESISARREELERIGAGELVDGKTIPSEPLKAFYQEAKELEILVLMHQKNMED